MYEFMFNKYSSEAASLGRKTREQNGIWNDCVILPMILLVDIWALSVGASKPYFLHFELNNKWLKSFLWVFSAPPSWRRGEWWSVGVM